MKVWMRGRFASRSASAQRSMSFSEARANPATEAFFTRPRHFADALEIAGTGDREARPR